MIQKVKKVINQKLYSWKNRRPFNFQVFLKIKWPFCLSRKAKVKNLLNRVAKMRNHAFIAQRNLAERARLLVLHSSADGRIVSGAISR